MPFQPGNQEGKKAHQKAKPYRDALMIEEKLAAEGIETPAKPGSLRFIARAQLLKAGEDTAAAREIADRVDGKVPQAIAGIDEDESLTPLVPVINLTVGPKPDPASQASGSVPDQGD